MRRIEADPIALEIMWSRLVTVVDEMWLTVCRTAFSLIISEAQDFACELLDAKGESSQLVQGPSRGRRTNGRVITQELTMLFKANPGQGDPTQLVLNGVRTVTIELPFVFENVPLPAAPAR